MDQRPEVKACGFLFFFGARAVFTLTPVQLLPEVPSEKHEQKWHSFAQGCHPY